ncbi:MAG: threonine synthase [Hyphomicrobiales bacterium]|nr:threonine synthase [Hyphomicrobiales bacterium]
MHYVSTRGQAPKLGFEDVLLAGLACDGGLYVPDAWPAFGADEIAELAGMPYVDAAAHVIRPFVGDDIGPDELTEILTDAYATFTHPAIAPLVQIAPEGWILELFHGPTLAFKDFAMQVLARLMDRALVRRSKRATIVGATSGDTGGAAVEAFRGREAVDLFILHPKGRVSDVQRRQMTTAHEDNVHNIAIEGTFDDCQALVKAMFNDAVLRDRLSLAAVNSINWARIMVQTVYYFTSAVALGAPHRSVSFSVPTGNFGDIFAGYVAAQMGLPIKRLVIATNVNDILARALNTGRYESKDVVATSSPSMDIQVSSNFERLIFESAGRDAAQVRALMDEFSTRGYFDLSRNELDYIAALLSAHRTDEAETRETMRVLLETTGYLADPHTAVGLDAAGQIGSDAGPVITLATAHPAKFPDAVKQACGRTPELPAALGKRLDAEERYAVLTNDLQKVSRHIEQHARILAGAG